VIATSDSRWIRVESLDMFLRQRDNVVYSVFVFVFEWVTLVQAPPTSSSVTWNSLPDILLCQECKRMNRKSFFSLLPLFPHSP